MKNTDKATNHYLKGIFDNDTVILRKIYQEYFGRIAHMVNTNNGTEDEAKDVFQDALLVIYEKKFDEQFVLTCGFYTYLYAICRNLWYDRQRGKKAKKEDVLDEQLAVSDEYSTQEAIVEHRKYELYRQKWELLGEECKKLLNLAFDKVSGEQIVSLMQYSSVSYARKRKFLCKERLKKLIQEDKDFAQIANGDSLIEDE